MNDVQEKVKGILDREIIGRRLAAGYTIAMSAGKGAALRIFSGSESFAAGSRPYGEETLFNLGSTTKPFTSALVLKLCEEFGVSLDDPVQRYIPEYPFGDVTLLMLMTHTAGYGPGEISLSQDCLPFGQADARAYLRSLYAIRQRSAAPDTACMYFSPGYTMLMDVIERVAACGIEAYARARIFHPLGMGDTTYEVRRVERRRNPVPTHFAQDGTETPDARWADMPAIGEAGMTSTCEDLLKFGRMILDGGVARGRTLFSQQSVHRMIHDVTGGRFYHTGVFMCRGEGEGHPTCFCDAYSANAVAHAGFCGTMLWVEPALGMTAAVLTNSTRVGEEWYSGRGNLMWRISALLRDVALGNGTGFAE